VPFPYTPEIFYQFFTDRFDFRGFNAEWGWNDVNLSANLRGNLSSALSVSEWGVNDANLSVNMSANLGSTLSVKWLLTSLGVGRFYGTCLGYFYSKILISTDCERFSKCCEK